MVKSGNISWSEIIAGILVKNPPSSGGLFYFLMKLGIINANKVVPHVAENLSIPIWGGHDDEVRTYGERAEYVLLTIGRRALPPLRAFVNDKKASEETRRIASSLVTEMEGMYTKKRMAVKRMTRSLPPNEIPPNRSAVKI